VRVKILRIINTLSHSARWKSRRYILSFSGGGVKPGSGAELMRAGGRVITTLDPPRVEVAEPILLLLSFFNVIITPSVHFRGIKFHFGINP